MSILKLNFMVLIFGVFGLLFSGQVLADNSKALEAAKAYIQEKSQLTGNYDIYDESQNKVRNLKLIETQESSGAEQTVLADFRDINSGDIVRLKFNIMEENGAFTVTSADIAEVKTQVQDQAAQVQKKEISSEEVKTVIEAYIKKMTQFTKTYGLYDEQSARLRNLEYIQIKEGMRNYGVLYISTVEFKDVDAAELVNVDITVRNQAGNLAVEAVKIVKISKQQ